MTKTTKPSIKHKNSINKNKSRKSKSQRGGSPTKKHKSLKSQKSQKSKSQRGGSPASSLVMEALTDPPVMNDYFPRVGGSSCQKGGSTASDMVNSNLNSTAQTVDYSPGFNPKGNIESLNTYEISGGAAKRNEGKHRKNRKYHMSKKNSKNRNEKKHKSNKNKRNKSNKRNNKSNRSHMMRGGSDWISSQYSLGNINAGGMNNNDSQFSVSQGVDRNTLMNPPTLGLAGSGYPMGSLEGANVNSVGAPLV